MLFYRGVRALLVVQKCCFAGVRAPLVVWRCIFTGVRAPLVASLFAPSLFAPCPGGVARHTHTHTHICIQYIYVWGRRRYNLNQIFENLKDIFYIWKCHVSAIQICWVHLCGCWVQLCGSGWVHLCGCWVHLCGCWVHLCGCWVHVYGAAGCMYADVGCMSFLCPIGILFCFSVVLIFI